MPRKYRVTFQYNGQTDQREFVANDANHAKQIFAQNLGQCKLVKLEEGGTIQPQNRPMQYERPEPGEIADGRPREENDALDRIARAHAMQSANLVDYKQIDAPKLENLNEQFVSKIVDPRIMQAMNRPAIPVQDDPILSQMMNMPAMPQSHMTNPQMVAPAPVAVQPNAIPPEEQYKYFKNGMRLNKLTMKMEKKDWTLIDVPYRVLDEMGTVMEDMIVQVEKWVEEEEDDSEVD